MKCHPNGQTSSLSIKFLFGVVVQFGVGRAFSLSITKNDQLKEANQIGPPGNQSGLDEFVPPAAEQRSELSPGRVCEPWVTNGNLSEPRSGEREPLNAA